MNVKLVLFFCLSFILALPVQSQVPTDTPLSVPVPDCGLPTAPTTWTSSTTQKVWNLTANCEVPRWPRGNAYIRVHSGEFTINGNGYSIIGGGNNWVVMAQGNGTVLNLNNIAIRGDGFIAIGTPLTVRNGARLNARNLIIRDLKPQYTNDGGIAAVWISGTGAEAAFTNVQFINNDAGEWRPERGTALQIWNAGPVSIDGGIFKNNRGHPAVVRLQGTGDRLTLRGCILFENNLNTNGTPATDIGLRTGAAVDDQRDNSRCPKPKPKPTPTPWPTKTPRPPSSYSQEYTELQQDTGIAISATHGLGSDIHFRQLDGAGIGIQSLIDAGPLAALDVYGYVEQGVEICFPYVGRVILLDAATIPRTQVPLQARVAEGRTCVWLDRPGSLVLLPPE